MKDNDWSTQGIKIEVCVPSRRTAKILRRVIKEAKKQHDSRLAAKSNNKIKTTWNGIKEDTGKTHLVELVPTFL